MFGGIGFVRPFFLFSGTGHKPPPLVGLSPAATKRPPQSAKWARLIVVWHPWHAVRSHERCRPTSSRMPQLSIRTRGDVVSAPCKRNHGNISPKLANVRGSSFASSQLSIVVVDAPRASRVLTCCRGPYTYRS